MTKYQSFQEGSFAFGTKVELKSEPEKEIIPTKKQIPKSIKKEPDPEFNSKLSLLLSQNLDQKGSESKLKDENFDKVTKNYLYVSCINDDIKLFDIEKFNIVREFDKKVTQDWVTDL